MYYFSWLFAVVVLVHHPLIDSNYVFIQPCCH